MTDRQKRFAEYYAKNPNATEAAKQAGYSEKTAYSSGQRMLKNVEVIGYIRQLQDDAAKGRLLSVVRVKAYLSDVIEDQTEKTADRLKAADLFLKAAGEYIHLRPDRDDPGIYVTGEADGTDVVIYLPQIDREEDHQVNDPEGDQVIKTELSEDWKT